MTTSDDLANEGLDVKATADPTPSPTPEGTQIACRCIWHGVQCRAAATQEDGLCDWCGVRRPEDLRDSPNAIWSSTGEYLGLADGTVTGYNHQAGWGDIPDNVRPTACWMETEDLR